MVDPEVRAEIHGAIDDLIDGCEGSLPELVSCLMTVADGMKHYMILKAHLERSDAAETN